MDFPALVALIEHPTGPVLFDTGYSHRFIEQTERWPDRLHRLATPMTLREQDSAVHQLADLGIAADQVEAIVLSHAHADHSAGLSDFPNARIAHSHREFPENWRASSRAQLLRRAMLPGLLPLDLAERSLLVEERPEATTGLGGRLSTGRDLLGDGSVLVVDLAGHTAGQVGVYLPRTQTSSGTQGPPLLLVGDACWHREAFTDGRLPPAATVAAMASPAEYRAVIAGLARVARERPDVLIVPSHCTPSIEAATSALNPTDPAPGT